MIYPMTYHKMENLPAPTHDDMIHRGIEPSDHWSCHYCGDGEAILGITTTAEYRRALTHHAICPKRPVNDLLNHYEISAAFHLFIDYFNGQIESCDREIKSAKATLRRTWWPPARWKLRQQIGASRKQRWVLRAGTVAWFPAEPQVYREMFLAASSSLSV